MNFLSEQICGVEIYSRKGICSFNDPQDRIFRQRIIFSDVLCIQAAERIEVHIFQIEFTVVDHDRVAFSAADIADLAVDIEIYTVIFHGHHYGNQHGAQADGGY